MTYNFKLIQELGWAALTGAVVAVAQIMFVFRPEEISDWRLWIVTAAGAIARAVGAALVTAIGSGKFQTS